MGQMTACTVLGKGGGWLQQQGGGIVVVRGGGIEPWCRDNHGNTTINRGLRGGKREGGREGGQCNRDGDCGIGGGGDNATGDDNWVGGEWQGDSHYKTTSINTS